jgi:polysaccharide pyruvyl transferase WcaK-like protein
MVQTSTEPIDQFKGYDGISIESRFHTLFLFEGDFLNELRWLCFLRNVRAVYMIGADTVDESYSASQSLGKLAALRLCSQLGVNTSLVSFSVNCVSNPLKDRMSVLSKHIRLCPRDPHTLARLALAGVTTNVEQAADLSLLVRPASSLDTDDFAEWLSDETIPTVGVNVGHPMFPQGVDRSCRLSLLAEALIEFAEQEQVRLLLMPNSIALVDLYYRDLMARMEALGSSRCRLLQEMPEARVYKKIISQCEYIFSTSLHISLFAMSVDIPVTCFPYLNKFDGVLELFGVPERKIEIDAIPADPSAFSDQLRVQYRERARTKAAIQQNRSYVVELARRNVVDRPEYVMNGNGYVRAPAG